MPCAINVGSDPTTLCGLGAGGKQTNINGLEYEAVNDLSSEYTIQGRKWTPTNQIKFNDYPNNIYLTGKKSLFHKEMQASHPSYKEMDLLHGTKEPDRWFISRVKKIAYIVEIKFQKTNGSVCEKLQTPSVKLRRLMKMYPDFKIYYIYGLSPWFRDQCKAEIEELREDDIPYFWGDSLTFKKEIVDFINNH